MRIIGSAPQEVTVYKEKFMSGKETETKFLILKSIDDSTVFSLGAQASSGWTWIPSVDRQIIMDTYYDTADRELRKMKFGLRIRVVGALTLVTFKGPAVRGPSGTMEREEFEGAPDEDFFSFLVSRIISLGVHLNKNFKWDPDPHELLTNLGLVPIQRRTTTRVIRSLCHKNSLEPGVELALDTVLYKIGNFAVTHREIEVEMMKGGSAHHYQKLVLSLGEAFLPIARVWMVDKLALGFWLEEYNNLGLLQGFVDSNGRLGEKAYELIEKEILEA